MGNERMFFYDFIAGSIYCPVSKRPHFCRHQTKYLLFGFVHQWFEDMLRTQKL